MMNVTEKAESLGGDLAILLFDLDSDSFPVQVFGSEESCSATHERIENYFFDVRKKRYQFTH